MSDTWRRLTERFRSRPLRCAWTASDIRLRLRLASILSPSNGTGQAVKRPFPFGPNGGAMPTKIRCVERGTWNNRTELGHFVTLLLQPHIQHIHMSEHHNSFLSPSFLPKSVELLPGSAYTLPHDFRPCDHPLDRLGCVIHPRSAGLHRISHSILN